MTRYLVIALALMVGGVLGLLLAKYQRGQEKVLVEENKKMSLLPWVAGFVVLIAGLFLLADGERAPKDAEYKPATLEDGGIKPGSFEPNTQNTDQ
jgi:ABC-type dipeptide/oligopeptide/nickel transport system permease subunit